jgi:hypothetical protein
MQHHARRIGCHESLTLVTSQLGVIAWPEAHLVWFVSTHTIGVLALRWLTYCCAVDTFSWKKKDAYVV